MQNFFKRGAFGGPFYQKSIIPRFKKVKCVNFKAYSRLNLGPTPKKSGECLLVDPIGKNAIFFKRWAFGGPFYQKGVVRGFKKVKCVNFKAIGGSI